MTTRVTIDTMGAGGDGVAMTSEGQVFVPFTLPGEVANIAREKSRGTLMALIEASPERIDPACRHFEACGGCALQHWQENSYGDWKRGLVADALAGRRLNFTLEPLVPCAPHTRRRAVFAVRRTEQGVLFGFHRHQSHEIIDIHECVVTVPAIVERLADLRQLAALLAQGTKPFKLTVTATASGLDIAAVGCGLPETAKRRTLTTFMLEKSFARLTCEGEIIIEPRKPLIHFGKVAVQAPPGGFLQATAEAEEAMSALVMGHLAKTKRAADLFCGTGTFTFRMAEKMAVHAVETDAAALAALDHAARNTQGLKPITTERRDLFRRPLMMKELARFDGVVFDPPRAGAEAQAKEIAKSNVAKVAAISCSPVTLARDLAILTDGGYRIDRVIPIDQFLWSSHVEAVALLSKGR
ncbi:class I SAM-dependent RNA methyltransferase [Phyllobacterium salinisoli]|uniref:Class I SAM-dependent RNA methyltransferase n=1 Tax=Phyllobacterium salinisoli TaxID=1899321 RepID=A0A368K4H7_9HYPH|nr:class I SAM-dependent RNA methyltransferase [Phyllobacterium salinisoli]RCS23383.1 class I SAM-dependent RNA methyltransferase [Phyllobacterium salinisoli]